MLHSILKICKNYEINALRLFLFILIIAFCFYDAKANSTSIWFLLGVVLLILNDFNNWYDYFWIIMALVYFGIYYYEYLNQYLTIENGTLKVKSLFGRKINLAEIKGIKRFAGDYIIKTDKKDLTINTQIIDPDSLAELNAQLEKLNVQWN